MKIKRLIVGMLETNCYILENDNECLIIDPGSDFEVIKNNVDKKVVGILLTHNHFDHVGAIKNCLEYYKVILYNFENLKEGFNKISTFDFLVNYNPGHTMDSISFIFDNIMFSGDFIFKGCIGRWDLGGDFNLMKDSITKLIETNINYNIYPGHGESTTLSDEKNMLESYIK
ncbi:MAG: MBL fold metallo-hydrolase [Bacilli bacterium]|nr:MBL fold metallo-hydrolase [Bacilli bacterium]